MTDENEQPETAEATIADLGSVFEGDDAQETPSEQVTKTEESEVGETEGEEAKGEKTETPADEESWTKQAALDERRKRQDAEKRAKELEEELAKVKREEKKVEIPDPVEDPEGYAKYLGSEALKTKINLSRDLILSLDAYKDDYEEMEKHFVEMAKENPVLAQKMNASPNPAKFAYETAKADKEVLKLKDPKYIADLVEQEVQKRLADLGKPAPSKAEQRKKSAVEVPDLTKATAKGSNSEPGERLPGLSEIFED